jgi:hypothetical protein
LGVAADLIQAGSASYTYKGQILAFSDPGFTSGDLNFLQGDIEFLVVVQGRIDEGGQVGVGEKLLPLQPGRIGKVLLADLSTIAGMEQAATANDRQAAPRLLAIILLNIVNIIFG